MLTSARYGIVYPNPNRSDSADVPRDIGALVTAVERSVMYSQGTFATRPTSTAGTPGIQGRMYYATDTQALYYDYGTGWILIMSTPSTEPPTVPLGATLDWPWASGSIPSWSVLSYGQLLAGPTYPAMQALADTSGRPYGGSAGSNFGVPDYRGRVAAGKDDMGGSAAARITVSISGITGTTLGAVGGAEGVTLTTATIPAHNHGISGSVASGNAIISMNQHAHGLPYEAFTGDNTGVFRYSAAGSLTPGAAIKDIYAFSSTNNVTPTGVDTGHAHGVGSLAIANAGSGGTHQNTQPTIVVNKLIRVL